MRDMQISIEGGMMYVAADPVMTIVDGLDTVEVEEILSIVPLSLKAIRAAAFGLVKRHKKNTETSLSNKIFCIQNAKDLMNDRLARRKSARIRRERS